MEHDPTITTLPERKIIYVEPFQHKKGAFALLFSREITADPRSPLCVLLVYRNDLNLWNLPGGGVENDESLDEAVTREVLEETGLVVKKVGTSAIAYDTAHDDPGEIPALSREDVYAAIVCFIEGGALTKTEESRDARWFPVDALPPNTYVRHAAVIQDAVENEGKFIDLALQRNTFVPKDIPVDE